MLFHFFFLIKIIPDKINAIVVINIETLKEGVTLFIIHINKGIIPNDIKVPINILSSKGISNL